jgi:hypothetical protein
MLKTVKYLDRLVINHLKEEASSLKYEYISHTLENNLETADSWTYLTLENNKSAVEFFCRVLDNIGLRGEVDVVINTDRDI